MFEFADRVWFIAPDHTDLDDLCRVILKGEFEDSETHERFVGVYAFSDDDLARRYLERASAPKSYRAFSPADDQELILLLARLHYHGNRLLGIDPETDHYAVMRIAAAVDQIRRRAGQTPG